MFTNGKRARKLSMGKGKGADSTLQLSLFGVQEEGIGNSGSSSIFPQRNNHNTTIKMDKLHL